MIGATFPTRGEYFFYVSVDVKSDLYKLKNILNVVVI